MQTSAAPRGLDDQDRLAQKLLQGEAECELRADLVGIGAKARRQLPFLLREIRNLITEATDGRNPDLLTDSRLTVRIPHLFEEGSRLRIIGHRVEC